MVNPLDCIWTENQFMCLDVSNKQWCKYKWHIFWQVPFSLRSLFVGWHWNFFGSIVNINYKIGWVFVGAIPKSSASGRLQGIRHYSNSVSSLHYSYFLKCNEYSLHFSLLQQCSFDKLQFSLHYITYGGGWECTNRSISITPNITVVVLISKCISTMNVYVTHSCNHQTCIAIRIRI